MAQAKATRGGVARLFYGAADSEVIWDGSTVRLGGGQSARELPVSHLSQPASVVPGAFWAGLVLETAQGPLRLQGFRQADLEALAGQVNAALGSYATQVLEVRCQALRALAQEVVGLAETAVYVRDARRGDLAARCSSACTSARDRLWQRYASAEQVALFEYVRYFATQSESFVADANARFCQRELDRFQQLFNTVESKPLTHAQRLACVRDEASNLVLAGAGTGKTSTMIGRAGYLIASGIAEPSAILMIAYARKAAQEMQERQDARLAALSPEATPKIKTFHALGLEIIGEVEGKRPDISPLAEDAHAMAVFVDDQIRLNCEDEVYQAKLIRYCGSGRYPYRNPFDFDSLVEYTEYVRQNELRTLKGELVKSFEELEIANLLNAYSVTYVYESAYEHDTSGPDYRQYRPDFYLPDHGIYLEHFALGSDGKPPHYFDQEKYLQGVEWKRQLHQSHETTLLETYSYLKREDRLESMLLEQLTAAGVELVRRPEAEMLAELREGSQVAEFAALLSDFLALFKESGWTLPALREATSSTLDGARSVLMLDLMEPVLHAYNEKLSVDGHIDFADMIARATEHVLAGRYASPYAHIMIDEFQDISASRARLALALHAQQPAGSLFAVGDDWQAIYRFAGSDISYTREFSRVFGAAAFTSLDRTFRFNEKLGQAASNFVLRSPAQIVKSVESHMKVDEPALVAVRTLTSDAGLRTALAAIDEAARGRGCTTATVLVLARFHHVLDDPAVRAVRQKVRSQHPSLKVEFMTVHASKGKEADYVVLLGLTKGKWGFPSEKPADSLMEYLLPKAESFPMAEERRLFYVAMTRARHRVYLAYSPIQPSRFVLELLADPERYPVARNELSGPDICGELPVVSCPTCKTGILVPRTGPYGAFVACDSYPYCEHKEKPCQKCGGIMSRSSGMRICTTPGCTSDAVPVCGKCGADMVLRSGGKFWGCTNYGSRGFSCDYTEKLESFSVAR